MLFADLRDSFTGPLDYSRWPQSYGLPTTAAGRVRIPCTTGYAGLKSASAYTLAGSRILARAYPPAPGGAASAALSLLVLTSTPGTDAGWLIDSAQNAMGMYVRDGWGDPGAVFLTYSPTDHAWLQLREAGGTLYWETSPDGVAWTVRRTAPTPGWAAATDLTWLAEAHRDSGIDDVAELAYVNLPPTAVDIGAARTRSAARPAARSKTAPVGTAPSTAGARPVRPVHSVPVGPARTRSRAQPIVLPLRPARALTASTVAAARHTTASSGTRLTATSSP
ncbi:hypothetical protein ACIPQA_16480 [Streptomyces sp. NPDC090109]|uniref:hypothetical protein n=1 Tax=Streptomyces sp. NPDC090109 TaxID=3365948 RepID=UPI00382D682E